MLPKSKNSAQSSFFLGFEEQLSAKHPLYILANKIEWPVFENAFKKHYSSNMGKPSKPIRLMVALLILKYVRNLSDESVVEQWAENSYYQYFSGEHSFVPGIPCVPTELVAFRHRIGEEGMELILKESIRVNEPPEPGGGATLSLDTTVQEKNITYPTDDKLYKKIIKACWKIADKEDINLRQPYNRVLKKLSTVQRFKKNKNGFKKARAASKAIKSIAGRLVRELGRKLPIMTLGQYLPRLKIYQQVLSQKKGDSGKIYSLHEPDTKCYSKGKEHKKFEFGSKASVLVDQNTGIIVGACNFTQTLHDSRTVPDALEQYERLTGRQAAEVFVDRGYRGIKTYRETKIYIPGPQKNITKSKRKKHSRRAAIEPIIGHLKTDYRLGRNFLKGIMGDNINIILSAAAMNFKRAMNLWRTEAIARWKLVIQYIVNVYRIFMLKNLFWTF